jgi:hypothetical protein
LNFGSRLFIEHVTNNAEGGDWQIGKQKRARSPPPLHRNEQAGRGGGWGWTGAGPERQSGLRDNAFGVVQLVGVLLGARLGSELVKSELVNSGLVSSELGCSG